MENIRGAEGFKKFSSSIEGSGTPIAIKWYRGKADLLLRTIFDPLQASS